MLLYSIIFFSKVLENTLGTLRLIVVADGRKLLGSILQGVISLIWILVVGIVVQNILEDPYKIVFFILGSVVGSYLGGIIEEKLALGNNMVIIITELNDLANNIRSNGFGVTSIRAEGKDSLKNVLFIIITRKNIRKIINTTKKYDQNALIISESIKI
ncbi:MAG: DUF5698 domain-containing protein [Bacilli bacterium]|nr:DUF5698 domain-containing protein [Bacilli bacterium]MDD4733629.1 DUF5698 domain-containing protein [Bacilli bacterium]